MASSHADTQHSSQVNAEQSQPMSSREITEELSSTRLFRQGFGHLNSSSGSELANYSSYGVQHGLLNDSNCERR